MKDWNYLEASCDDVKLERIIESLLYLWKKKIKSWINQETFLALMKWIQRTFNHYEIDKVYNSTIIPSTKEGISSHVWNLLWIVSSSNMIPLKFKGNGWTCFDWAILMLNIFTEIDPSGKIKSEIIQFKWSIHTVVLISFGGVNYLIDSFAKWWEYMYELTLGTEVFLWEKNGKQDYAEVTSLSPLSFKYSWENIDYNSMNWDELSWKVSITTFWWMVRVRDFYDNEELLLNIDIHTDNSNSYTVEFNDIFTYWDISVMSTIVERATTSYDFLLGVINYNAPELTKYGEEKLRYLAGKIDLNYLKTFFGTYSNEEF